MNDEFLMLVFGAGVMVGFGLGFVLVAFVSRGH